MGKKDLLIQEIQKVPEPLLDEVLDFVRLLKARFTTGPTATAIASEASLAKDWLRPEEDKAWESL